MSDRVVHTIHAECEIYIEKIGTEVRIRFTEKDPELLNPTDFEIQGTADKIREAFAFSLGILDHLDAYDKEPS